MTALLDTPLPQLRPPACIGALPLDRVTVTAPGPAAVAQRTSTAPRPLRPAPRRSGPPAPHRLSPRARRGVAASGIRPQRLLATCGGAAAAAALARPALRLTRRARLLVTVVSALSLLAVIGLAALNADPMQGGLEEAPASVVVQTGDTLWQIAAEVAPAEDPAVVVELLRSANDLGGAALQPGQVLVVPSG